MNNFKKQTKKHFFFNFFFPIFAFKKQDNELTISAK